ncbi:MAG TPA: ABC transporter permease [Phaeodactylibacter sp.]|nr:ABC transporter permease [Phaeodactylibacter sp.]
MWKIFAAFVTKEFRHILRDKRTLSIMLGMPIALMLIFGYAVRTDFREAGFATWDQAHDRHSSELIQRMKASGYFREIERVQNRSEIEHLFRQGLIKAAVVIPPSFGESLEKGEKTQLQLLTDGTEPNTATTLLYYLSGIVANYQKFLTEKAVGPLPPPPLRIEQQMIYNPDMKSTFMFVPGVITVVLMLISAMLTSLSIAREKEKRTIELLLISPLPPVMVIVGKVIPYMLISFLNGMTIIAMGILVFGMPMRGDWLFLLGSFLLFILTALSLGILISTRVQTQQTALFASLLGLMLPTVLLSGYIFPIESMPAPLQVLSNVTPAKWFIIILKGIMLKGIGIELLWKPVLVLCGMTAAFLLLSWKSFKIHIA